MTTSINARRGAELRALRKQLGLTQAQLARELGKSSNTVARWERGEVPINGSAWKLAQIISKA